ncbi:MAG: hypothetical protein ACQESE_03725 [Nanobdellota archaeon]
MKKLIAYGAMAISLIPQALAADHSVTGDLTGFVDGFRDLINGNSAGFVDGLVGALPLVGLFVIVFGLTFFLTKTTIFKKDDQGKYARMVAIGIALLGLAQQSVYNLVLGLSRSFLILAFLFAFIMMAIMFVNTNRKNYFDIQKETFDSMKTKLESQKELQKARDDLKKDKKYYTRSRNELQRLDGELRDMSKLSSDELRAVDKLIDLVTRAHSAAAEGAADKIHAYSKVLNTGISGLVTSMNHEHKHLHKVDELLADIESVTKRWGQDEKEEEHEEERLAKIFAHYEKLHGTGKIGKDLHKIDSDITGIKDHLRELHNGLRKARQMEHRLKELKSKLNDHSVKHKHDTAEAVREAIVSNDFNTAHSKLDNLRYLITHQRELFGELREEEQALNRLFSYIEHHERAVVPLIADISRNQKKATSDERNILQNKLLGKVKTLAKEIELSTDQFNELKPQHTRAKSYAGAHHFSGSLISDLERLVNSTISTVNAMSEHTKEIFENHLRKTSIKNLSELNKYKNSKFLERIDTISGLNNFMSVLQGSLDELKHDYEKIKQM